MLQDDFSNACGAIAQVAKIDYTRHRQSSAFAADRCNQLLGFGQRPPAKSVHLFRDHYVTRLKILDHS
ncbi:hypothetical protein D3C76_1732800 [compost metagenome]